MDALAQLAFLVVVVLAIVGVLALRRRILARMALRNITRRKRYVAIVVSGLLVATAMISGSLVVGDTLDYLIKNDIYESTGAVDIVVSALDDVGERLYFNQSVAYDLIDAVGTGELQHIDAAAPAIRDTAPIINTRTNGSSPMATLFAFDPGRMINPLVTTDGRDVTAADFAGGKAVINEDLAGDLDAVPGDTLIVITDEGMMVPLEVSVIAKGTGMGQWQFDDILFLDLSFAQTAVFNQPDMINLIDVSNAGGVTTGYLVTDQAVEELETALPSGYTFEFSTVKKDGVETAEQTSDQITQIFVIMSSFAIIAGVMLIVNILVMLAEERKPEMGISRAVGMQRGDLTRTFMFEGVVYALMASAVGAFVGLVIAGVMMVAFGTVFGEGLALELHFEWESLGIAACAGFLITSLTVIAASWRVSKLNIVRAIRDIPEPILAKSEKKYMATGLAAMVLGILITMWGASAGQASGTSSGPSLIAFGTALVAVRFAHPRIPFTAAGLFMILWTLDPLDIEVAIFGEIEGNIEMFIVAGVLLVTGGVLIAIFNSDLLLRGLVRVFGRRRSLLPIFRIAMSYPMNKKFRTGLTLFIFSLIMFTVIIVAMIASFQRESVDTIADQYSAGFDILGISARDIPRPTLAAGLAEINETFGAGAMKRFEIATTAPISAVIGGNESYHSTLIGFDDSMIQSGGLSLVARADEYATDQEVWNAVAADPSLIIMDGSVQQTIYGPSFGLFSLELGEQFSMALQNGSSVNVTVVGMTDQIFLQGAFTSADVVRDLAPRISNNLFYFETTGGLAYSNGEVAAELEKVFVEYGLTTIVIRDVIETLMSMVSSIMQLMEIFLGVGLIVGITGLGIITIRNIAERRQEIGVMRAIGFQRDMILKTFLLETSFVALLGIIMGVILGLALSYRMWDFGGFSETAPFVVPWWEVLFVVSVSFLVTLVSVLPPSRRASKLAPAEALRRVD